MSWLHRRSSKFKEVISDSLDLLLSKALGNRKKAGTEAKPPGARVGHGMLAGSVTRMHMSLLSAEEIWEAEFGKGPHRL